MIFPIEILELIYDNCDCTITKLNLNKIFRWNFYRKHPYKDFKRNYVIDNKPHSKCHDWVVTFYITQEKSYIYSIQEQIQFHTIDLVIFFDFRDDDSKRFLYRTKIFYREVFFPNKVYNTENERWNNNQIYFF